MGMELKSVYETYFKRNFMNFFDKNKILLYYCQIYIEYFKT